MKPHKLKMTKEELDLWVRLRKKCAPMRNKKKYSRKVKHKGDVVDD